ISRSKRALSQVDLLYPAPGITADVGGVVPGSVVHHGPTHKLCPRIMRVAIVIEEVRQREASCGDRVSIKRAPSSQLVRFAFERLFRGTKSEIVGDVEASEVRLR